MAEPKGHWHRQPRKRRGHHVRFAPDDPAYFHPRREGLSHIEWWKPINRWGALRMAQFWRIEAWMPTNAGTRRTLPRYLGNWRRWMSEARAAPAARLP
jgi:hypothetical protein